MPCNPLTIACTAWRHHENPVPTGLYCPAFKRVSRLKIAGIASKTTSQCARAQGGNDHSIAFACRPSVREGGRGPPQFHTPWLCTMRRLQCLGTLCLTVGLTACSHNPSSIGPTGYTLRMGGDSYVIRQLTASTWTATTSGLTRVLADDAKAGVLNAIERSSGCRVTDSDFSLQGRQLDAQVDCESSPKSTGRQVKK